MSDDQIHGGDAHATAVYRKRGFPIIWLLPLVAILAAGWFLWSTLSSRGPEITIRFETADGLEIGKSQVKHKDVVLGTVIGLRPVDGFKHIDVRVRMNHLSEDYLNRDTKFWIVRPRVSIEGITGLNTLLSGAYIELTPGGGERADDFVGLEAPPLISPDARGAAFTLRTDDLGTLEQGSSVIYHGVKVGEVLGYQLSSTDLPVAVQIFINEPYTGLVHTGTRFWNASGVQVSVGAQGLKVSARSLQTIFLGGIMFDVPKNSTPGSPAKSGDSFVLFSDEAHADDSIYTTKIRFNLRFAGSIAGVDPADQVTLFGQQIGEVEKVHIEVNGSTGRIDSLVTVSIEPEHLNLTDIDLHSPDIEPQLLRIFQRLADKNLRAQLISSNLLTGEKEINFAVVEDAAPAKIILGGPYPEFPTQPSDDLNSVMHSAKTALNSVDTLISSPEMKHSIQELNKTLTNIDSITHQTADQIGPLLTQLRSFANTADETVKKAGASTTGGGDLPGALREMKDAARSVRILADYLESHPEALLRGKSQ
jgi:paraquat-inducible protein B